MARLRAGNQIFHNGIPVELLYRIGSEEQGDIWRVRPLFVAEADRDDLFRAADRISFLHTINSPSWARAA